MFCLTYEFRLQPNRQQLAIFEDWLEINRKVYNYALAERKHWYKSRSCQINCCSLHSDYIISVDTPRPTFALQCKSLTVAKEQYPDLKRVAAQVLQQTLKRVESAFTSMWERNFGFPRFKKVGQLRSFVFSQPGKNPFQQGLVKLPVIGAVKFRQLRDIPSDATVKQTRIVKQTSQICPNCQTQTGKKDLSERVHVCESCGYTTDRDVAAAQVVLSRGLAAAGLSVKMRSGG